MADDALRSVIQALALERDERSILAALTRQWTFCARPPQRRALEEPRTVLSCGRGGGKGRSCAEAMNDLGEIWGSRLSGLICGRSIGDTREQCIYGESGMLAVARRRGYELRWQPGRSLLSHPSGASWRVTSLELGEDAGRGANLNAVWIDEIFHASHDDAREALASILLAFRSDAPPPGRRMLISGTPNRHNPISRKILRDPTFKLLRWSTRANRENLSEGFVEEMESRFGTTGLAAQELLGELVAVGGGLCTQELLDECRAPAGIVGPDKRETFDRVVVAIDPAGTSNENSDETGIVCMARSSGRDGEERDRYFVLADRSGRYKPEEWTSIVFELAGQWDADSIVFESNFAADVLESTLARAAPRQFRDRIKGKPSRGSKRERAEPLELALAQRRVHLCGTFPALEGQLTEPWGHSPDRLDAMVIAFQALASLADEPTVGPLFTPAWAEDDEDKRDADAQRSWIRDYFAVD